MIESPGEVLHGVIGQMGLDAETPERMITGMRFRSNTPPVHGKPGAYREWIPGERSRQGFIGINPSLAAECKKPCSKRVQKQAIRGRVHPGVL